MEATSGIVSYKKMFKEDFSPFPEDLKLSTLSCLYEKGFNLLLVVCGMDEVFFLRSDMENILQHTPDKSRQGKGFAEQCCGAQPRWDGDKQSQCKHSHKEPPEEGRYASEE